VLAIEDSPDGTTAARAAGVPVVVPRSAYFAGTHIDRALAVRPGLHDRRGWQPALSLQNDSAAMVVLADLEAWWRVAQSAAKAGS
jgi:beta-phosphoglucomutase-like phosphatase (HAD superfamily)